MLYRASVRTERNSGRFRRERRVDTNPKTPKRKLHDGFDTTD